MFRQVTKTELAHAILHYESFDWSDYQHCIGGITVQLGGFEPSNQSVLLQASQLLNMTERDFGDVYFPSHITNLDGSRRFKPLWDCVNLDEYEAQYGDRQFAAEYVLRMLPDVEVTPEALIAELEKSSDFAAYDWKRCIAGHIVQAAGGEIGTWDVIMPDGRTFGHIDSAATALMNLQEDCPLFMPSEWPTPSDGTKPHSKEHAIEAVKVYFGIK